MVESVGLVAAKICEQRRLVENHFDLEITNAQADQGDRLPHFKRRAIALQRSLLVPICVFVGWAVDTVAHRVNGWPAIGQEGAGRSAIGDIPIRSFAAVIVLLGVFTGLAVTTASGRDGLEQLWGQRRALVLGACLAATLGALYATGGMWQQEPIVVSRLLLAILVWAALGLIGFGLACGSVALTQHSELADEIAELRSQALTRDAHKREKQAKAALVVVELLHDALLRQTMARGIMLVTHYYRINQLERRGTRDAHLDAFIEGDEEAVKRVMGSNLPPLCVCDLGSPPDDGGE